MHTGAMSSKRVLDVEFEKCLLPSGLQASLLIKATHRVRKRVSALSQYRTGSITRKQGQDDVEVASSNNANYGSLTATSAPAPRKEQNPAKVYRRESVQDVLPRPSVLNTLHNSNLRAVVEKVLALKASQSDQEEPKAPDGGSAEVGGMQDEWLSKRRASMGLISRTSMAGPLSTINERESGVSSIATTKDSIAARRSVDTSANVHGEPPAEITPASPRQRVSGLRASMSMLIRGHLRRSTRMQIEQEWDEENEVRDMYDSPPPAKLEEENEDDDDDYDDEEALENRFNSLYPRVKFLDVSIPTSWPRSESDDNPSISQPADRNTSRNETERLLPGK
jgi:hypothetical protein